MMTDMTTLNGKALDLPPFRVPALQVAGDLQAVPEAVPAPQPLTRRERRRIRREEIRLLLQQARSKGHHPWTRGERGIAVLQVILGLGITAAAFTIMFLTAWNLLYRSMHWEAAIVPVAGEITFAWLFLNGVLLALRRAPSAAFRAVLQAVLMAGVIVLQVWAARGSVPSLTGHLVVVAGFFGVMLNGKSTVLTLLGGKVRPDRIGAGSWIAHPVHSARLWRWQQSWGEPSAATARQRYRVLLYVIALAQADERVGKRSLRWRRELPPTLRYDLASGLLPDGFAAGQDGWRKAAAEHVREQLDLLPPLQSEGTPRGSDDDTSEGSHGGNGDGNPEGSGEGNDWPETKDIPKAQLMRRVRSADRRWTRQHGKPIPALQLGAQLKVRMSRETATSLLQQARTASKS